MEIKVMRVSPQTAREWLTRNTDNRPLRPSVVEGLKIAFQRGEYVTTHQGIAFAHDGTLLDGQHRLTAIAEMPADFSIELAVARNLPPGAFQAIDIGVKRTTGDILSVSLAQAAVARMMALLVEKDRTNAITPQFLVPFIEGSHAHYGMLMAYCSKQVKVWGSASIKTAAILRIMAGADRDYVLENYHALNYSEYSRMSPIVQSLHRQHATGKVRGAGTDLFVRAFRAFDDKRADVTEIIIKTPGNTIAEAREIITHKVLIQKKTRRVIPVRPQSSTSSSAGTRFAAFP